MRDFMGRRLVSRRRWIASIILALAVFLSAAYLFGVREARFFLVPSHSMEPTLLPNDYLVTLSQKEYQPGDIVVLTDPEEPGSHVVKRIVALPGQTVYIDGGALFINGAYASEPYIREPMNAILQPYPVPEGCVMVLGDNRNESEDSLSWGWRLRHRSMNRSVTDPPPSRVEPDDVLCPSISSIIGQVCYIYNPIPRMGSVKSYPLTTAHYATAHRD